MISIYRNIDCLVTKHRYSVAKLGQPLRKERGGIADISKYRPVSLSILRHIDTSCLAGHLQAGPGRAGPGWLTQMTDWDVAMSCCWDVFFLVKVRGDSPDIAVARHRNACDNATSGEPRLAGRERAGHTVTATLPKKASQLVVTFSLVVLLLKMRLL